MPARRESRNFIQQIIDNDRASGRVKTEIITRFPPEPNGYPHIGHAKAICLNFSLAAEFSGRCHLRFDDTNPETEDMEYVRAMKRDINWLGFDWGVHEYYASDYFEQLYDMAVRLIRGDKAFIDSQTGEEIRANRGTVTEPGTHSPFRNRSVEENLDLFAAMRAGEFADGAHVLRAKIDMASPNMLMRDPVLYRIKKAEHYRRGNDWPIYPLYDFAHPLSDAIEGITHSLCTLEFDVHRPLYDWLVEALFPDPRPHQYESARLNLDYTVTSKRKLLQLVKENHVDGWDDPRMPTISGMRRRGYTPEALRRFCDMIGVAKADNRVDMAMLEFAVRDDLNTRAPRVMCVIDPLKVVLTNIEPGAIEELEASYWPHDIPKEGMRLVPLTREIFIEQSDFMESPSKNFHRLSPGGEVRLRYGYIIRCDQVIKDESGRVLELHCSADLDTKSGETSGRKVKGTIHWVSASKGVPAEVRLYDRLFSVPDPDDVKDGESFISHLNPSSVSIRQAIIEPAASGKDALDRYQFERQGFFFLDPNELEKGKTVWNQTITLRDTWEKAEVPVKSAPSRKESTTDAAPVVRDPLEGLDKVTVDRANWLEATYGVGLDDAAILAQRPRIASFFEEASKTAPSISVANWLINELRPLLPDDGIGALPFSAKQFADFVELHASNTLSSRQAKEVLVEMVSTGETADAIVNRLGLKQISDESLLLTMVNDVLKAYPDRVEAYQGGKTGLIGFFMGQVMAKSGGAANPSTVKTLLEKALAS
ncbi:MAG: glutamine--tRNA ligase/YqeY domain fusion protein [Bacteroidetes bacterium]|nr:glutamine--tRNA ligase/YqeY domain fusion protein [Bacteroidota bacterium]